jgi:hypothetical protein
MSKEQFEHWYKYVFMYKHINPIIFFFQRIYEFLATKFYKPRIAGTWPEINKILKSFSDQPEMYDSTGLLVRFIGVLDNKYTPYLYVKVQRGILKFRKRSRDFMIPGCSGCHDITDTHKYFYELIEMPTDMWDIDIKEVQKKYRLKAAPQKQNRYY